MNNKNNSRSDLYDIILKEQENSKKQIKRILENVLKHEILNIQFEGIEHYENIIEYNFSLLKVNVIYKDKKSDEVYLKMIKGGKIKESIFCYWSLLYEEFLNNNQRNKENELQKAIITQVTSDESITSLLLTLNSRLNYYAEIELIELKSYLENNREGERWCDSLEIKNGDILFIGKKMY